MKKFYILLTGQVISRLGNGAYEVALGLIAYQITKNSLAVGLVFASFSVPQLLLMPVAGKVSRKYSKSSLLGACNFISGGASLVCALISVFDQVTLQLLVALAITLGVCSAISTPIYPASIPDLVPDSSLERANGLDASASGAALLLGPLFGSLLLISGGPSWVFAVDGGSFAIAGLCALLVRMRRPASLETSEGNHSVFGLLAKRWFRMPLLIEAAANLFAIGPFWVLVPMIASKAGGHGFAGAVGMGTASFSLGAGMLVGGYLIPRLVRSASIGSFAVLASLIGAGCMYVGFLEPVRFIVGPALLGIGISSGSLGVTILQRNATPQNLPEVMAVSSMFSLALIPLGQASAGLAGKLVEPEVVLASGGILTVAVCLLIAVRESKSRSGEVA